MLCRTHVAKESAQYHKPSGQRCRRDAVLGVVGSSDSASGATTSQGTAVMISRNKPVGHGGRIRK
jgi:hypothetical protein